MPKKSKTISNVILFIALIFITFFLIFKDYDFAETINVMHSAKRECLILAFLMMLLYFFFDSVNIKNILKSLGESIPILRIYKYCLISFFFSGITPGGGGGQPMGIYYMNKDGIPVTSATLTLLLNLGSYHVVTIVLGLISLYMNYHLLTSKFIWIFIVGLFLKLLVLFILLICIFLPKTSRGFIDFIVKVLEFFKYSKLETFKQKVNQNLETYNQSSEYIKTHKIIVLKSLLTVTLQVLCYYSVTYFVYSSFALTDYNYLKIISIQALLLVSTSSIPLPGAVGISEHAFLTVNETVIDKMYLPGALILSRGITFYLFMIISLAVVIINIIHLKHKTDYS